MQGLLNYAGIMSEGSFKVLRSRTLGSDPIIARFHVDAVLPPVGDISISFGANNLLLRKCRLVRTSIVNDGGGRMLEASFEDRRWLWRQSKIFADMGSSNPTRKKTLNEIVRYIVFNLLGEVNADVSAFNEPYYVDDFNPDGELSVVVLENLLSSRGYVATLSLDDRLVICRAGVGGVLPSDSLFLEGEVAWDSKPIPEEIHVLSSPMVITKYFELEPVGEEANGSIVHIDRLSYKPAGGWEKESIKTFSNVDEKHRDRAKRCVWRMYRIVPNSIPVPPDFPYKSGGVSEYPETPDIEDILPLKGHLEIRESYLDPPVVCGFFCTGRTSRKNNLDRGGDMVFWSPNGKKPSQIEKEFIYEGGFSLDVNKGIVKFSEPVFYKERNDGEIGLSSNKPASIWLLASFNVRNKNGGLLRMPYVFRNFGAYVIPGYRETVLSDELSYRYSDIYETDKDYFEKHGLSLVQDALSRMGISESQSCSYYGFRFDIPTDGRTDSIVWARDSRGVSTTSVDWQTETPESRLSYKEKVSRLQSEEVNKFIKKAVSTRRKDDPLRGFQ